MPIQADILALALISLITAVASKGSKLAHKLAGLVCMKLGIRRVRACCRKNTDYGVPDACSANLHLTQYNQSRIEESHQVSNLGVEVAFYSFYS